MKKLIELGVCRKPHGVRGAFSFHLENSNDSTLKKGSLITLKPLSKDSSINKEGQEFTIKTIGFGNKTIVELKGVDNRNTVEAMIPFAIYISREDLPELDEGEFYLSDLVGLKAIDDSGNEIGEVLRLSDNGVQDILVIKTSGENIEVLLIDQFVKEIDFEAGTVKVVIPEYL